MYAFLKWLLVTAVIASGAGFLARGALILAGSPRRDAPFVRIAPHVVDTVLLAAAVAMAFTARLSPLAQPWLAAKIAGLLVYIALGAVALRYGSTPQVRRVAFAGAVLAYAYVVGTALRRDPLWPRAVGS